MLSNDSHRRVGQSVDTVDQVSSITLAGLAIVGGAVAATLIVLLTPL